MNINKLRPTAFLPPSTNLIIPRLSSVAISPLPSLAVITPFPSTGDKSISGVYSPFDVSLLLFYFTASATMKFSILSSDSDLRLKLLLNAWYYLVGLSYILRDLDSHIYHQDQCSYRLHSYMFYQRLLVLLSSMVLFVPARNATNIQNSKSKKSYFFSIHIAELIITVYLTISSRRITNRTFD